MALKTINYRVLTSDAGRLDSLIARLLAYPRSRVRGLLDHEGAWVNGVHGHDHGLSIKGEELLLLKFDPARKYKEKPPQRKPQGFQLVYEDEYLAVVNKEAGILTVPTDRGDKLTLIDSLSHYLARGHQRASRVSVVHRLDRETSGLLVFAQKALIAEQLIKQFAAHKPEREYYAIVAGHLAQDSGEIRSLLSTDKALNQKSSARGELAVTHYRVIARYQDSSLVAVNLETGRRNQIRVHFAEKGHPILGDQRYESQRAAHKAWPYKRLALHARILGFSHPISHRELRFESSLPVEFQRFIEAYG